MSAVDLRLPQIAELIYRLKHEDNLPFSKIPLTVREARQAILSLRANGIGTEPEQNETCIASRNGQ